VIRSGSEFVTNETAALKVFDYIVCGAGSAGCADGLTERDTAKRGLQYVSRVIVTNKLGGCGAAKGKLLPGVNTGRIAISVTVPGTRVGQTDGGSGRCKAQITAPRSRLPNCPPFHLWPLSPTAASHDIQNLREGRAGGWRVWQREACTCRAD
jgi:hypothetical protein